MASYLSAPDYQSYVVNPYQLPTQQIVQAIDMRGKMWDAGASALKGQYQAISNMDLSRPGNRLKYNALLKEVEAGIKNSTQADLSIGENVANASKVFEPITKNQDIIGDDAITKHYKSQMQLAQSLRNQNGGKEYSDVNIAYMMKGLQDFSNSTDDWRNHYSNKRYYTPYYNVQDEISELEKSFKPSILSTTTPDMDASGKPTGSMYLKTTTDKSTTASQYKAYINSHLSDKAKRQLQISGSVLYKDNYNLLGEDYMSNNNSMIRTYQTEADRLKGFMDVASPNEKAIYQEEINDIQDTINKLKTENTKIKAGDLSFIRNNYDQVAGGLYTTNYLNNLSKASARKDYVVEYKPDQVALAIYKENKADDRLEYEWQNRFNLESIKEGKKNKDGQLVNPDGSLSFVTQPNYRSASEEDNLSLSAQLFDQMKTGSDAEFSKAYKRFDDIMKANGVVYQGQTKAQRDAAIDAWASKNPNHPDYTDWKAAEEKHRIDGLVINEVNNFVNNKLPEATKQRQKDIINGIHENETLVGSDGSIMKFTPNLLKEIFNGTNSTYRVISKTQPTQTLPFGMTSPPQGFQYAITDGSREWQIPQGSKLREVNLNLLNNSLQVAQERGKLLNTAMTRVEGIQEIIPTEKTKENLKSAEGFIFRKIYTPEAGAFKDNDISFTSRDRSGGVYFKVNPTDPAKVDYDKLEEKVKSLGGRFDATAQEYYLPNKEVSGIVSSGAYEDARFNAIPKYVDLKVANEPNSPFEIKDLNFNNRYFTVKVRPRDGVPLYSLYHTASGTEIFPTEGNRGYATDLGAALSLADQLGKQSKEDFTKLIRSLGNNKTYTE